MSQLGVPGLAAVQGHARTAGRRGQEAGRSLAVLARAGVIRPHRPSQLARLLPTLRTWGFTLAGGYAACAVRTPDRPAVIDDDGEVTFAELDDRTTAIAKALRARGLGGGSRIAVLAHNSRHPLEALIAISKIGADALLLNTRLSPAQEREILARERASAVVVDSDLRHLLDEVDPAVPRITAWGTGPSPTLDDLVADGTADSGPLAAPSRAGKLVILTSGTTGLPKGAVRPKPHGLGPLVAWLSRIPQHARGRTLIAAPLFHAWGIANVQLATALNSTVVLQRRFDPPNVLSALAKYQVDTLIAVPVMLQRLLEARTAEGPGDAGPKIVAVSGSALPGPLATRFMDAFGDVLYNFYGSTEVSWVTIARPEELRAYPGTAGRPPSGTRIALLDDAGEEVPAGSTGRVFVVNEMLFDGYTAGATPKEWHAGMMATGDVGHLDAGGLLFLDGRDDDMVISGGENLYPREVEDLLAGEAEVLEVCVVGVPDEEYGQRLAAYVALVPGATMTADDVQERVRARLARFSVPRDVVFLTELPRNAAGKVVPRELPASR